MSQLKENKKLIMSTYEMIELMNLYITKNNEKASTPVDYGTGEVYTSTEVHTVSMIHLNPGITAREIADKTARTQSAVSQMIAKLSEKGLLKTEKDPEDSRRALLYVTEKGKELSTCHMEYDSKRMEPRLKKLTEEFGTDAVNNFIQIMDSLIAMYDIEF